MTINNIIELSSAFSAEVNVDRDFDYRLEDRNPFLDGYLPNGSSRQIAKNVFDTLPARMDRKLHLITASYGTGKSYLLLVIGLILAGAESSLYDEIKKKIDDKDEFYGDGLKDVLQQHLLSKSKYLIVVPNYGTDDFDQAMLSALNKALLENEISYQPKTYYLRAAETLESWQKENSDLFKKFEKKLTGVSGVDFIRLLKQCDGASYNSFKNYYREIVSSDFSESHGDVYETFSDTAQNISALGYKGVVILYDEFGGVLDKLINKSAHSYSLKIQDFLERLKDRRVNNSNLIFIAASHQDPTTIQEDKQKNIDKIIGRFERHKLEIADSESEDLMSKVFITTNADAKGELLTASLLEEQSDKIEQHELYRDKREDWIVEKVVKGLYPLHPLSSFILPKISNQFAQNTRTMFNFLSPNVIVEGSLRNFIDKTALRDKESGLVTLFTPDMLLGFFEKNLSDAKSEAITGIVDSYQTTIGKFSDRVIVRVMQNILILTATRKEEVLPTFEILSWAMYDVNSTDLKHLLDELVHNETLEFNDRSKVYEFPAFNSKSYSKILKDIAIGSVSPSLGKCNSKWHELFPLPSHFFEEHNAKYGTNRSFRCLSFSNIDDFEQQLIYLRKFYQWESKEIQNQGFIAYLVTNNEDEIQAYKLKLEEYPDIKNYLIFATPSSMLQFDELVKTTFDYFVCEQAIHHPEITGNANHASKAKGDLIRQRTTLTDRIRYIFEPSKWKWSFSEIDNGIDLKSPRMLDRRLEEFIDDVFTSVLKIKDEAVWFSKMKVNDNALVIENIITPDKDLIPVSNNNNQSSSSRILERFFENLGITKLTKTVNKIQYGDIRTPDAGTTAEKIFNFFDKQLKVSSIVTPELLVKPLLNAPYGLSEQVIKMLLTSYIRYNRENLLIVDPKKPAITFDKSPTTIENIFKRSGNYAFRKLDMSPLEIRYLRQLNELFQNNTAANSFGEVSRRFIGLIDFFGPLNWTQISKKEKVKSFYDLLVQFKEQSKEVNFDREKDARIFFMQTLPDNLLNVSEAQFKDDDECLAKIMILLKSYKEFPSAEESAYKKEVILNLSTKTFNSHITTPEEFRGVVQNWFDKLSVATRRLAAFEDEKITLWMKSLRSDENPEILKFYLEDLSLLPVREWNDLMNDQFKFISDIGNYKKEIEAYKASPLVPYQAIARACFSMSANDCSTEEIFHTTFKKWWEEVPELTKEAQFEDDSVNIFLEEMKSSFNTRDKFLVNIPIRWKDNGLQIMFNSDWENWSAAEHHEIASRYADCVNAINSWHPPIEEKVLFEKIGHLFDASYSDSIATLNEFLLNIWYEHLPLNTKNAPFDKFSSEHLFLDAITKKALKTFVFSDFPKLLNLKDFQFWDQDILDGFIESFALLKNNILSYKRPLMELVEEWEKRQVTKSKSVNEFRMKLRSDIESFEVFKTMADREEGLIDNFNALHLLGQVRALNSEGDFWELINTMATSFNISEEYFLWTAKTQTLFIKEFNLLIDYLKKWRYPVHVQMENAKLRISSQVDEIQSDLKLTNSQIVKILRDVIGEKS